MKPPGAGSPRPLEILAISDEVSDLLYSGNLSRLAANSRMVVSCGDLPLDYLEFVVSLLNVPLYYVLGNHDGAGWWRSNGTFASHPEGCIHLEGRTFEEQGVLLAGLGGSIRYAPQAPYQFSETEMWQRCLRLAVRLCFNRLRRGRFLDVLVTHSAPLGLNDGPDPAHQGFASYLWLLKFARPHWHLHGHTTAEPHRPARQTWCGETEVIFVPPYRLLSWNDGSR